MEINQNFLRGGGRRRYKTETFGGVWIFSGTAHSEWQKGTPVMHHAEFFSEIMHHGENGN